MDEQKEIFSRIYDQYVEKIYRFIFLKVNSRETAEDLTSKVFLKSWEVYKKQGLKNNPQGGEKKNQKEIKNPRAFIYQIARNVVIDFYREKGRTQIVSVDSIPQMSDPRTNLEKAAILNSDLEIIKKALQNLNNDDYQNVIIWHYLDDLSISEIAKIWNKPEGTVRVILHRALKSLRRELRKLNNGV